MAGQISYRRRLAEFVGGKRFFWGVVVLLVLQAAWIALSGRYPMAFDENFHLGIIRLYAHHLSPFWSHQPAGADSLGPVVRDPSYLYHYLMSFPYRLASILTNDQYVRIMALRAIDIGLFAWGVAIYRRLLLKTGASRALVNGCLLIFVLLPIVPLLAAQINYDNLFLPLAGLALLWTVGFDEKLDRRRPIKVSRLTALLILCLLASLVKYAFLPLFAVIVFYLALRMYKIFGGWHGVWTGLVSGWNKTGRPVKTVITAALLISCLLFGQRYFVNLARYHTPVPDCGQVLGTKSCLSYGPWARDYANKLEKTTSTNNPAVFAADWLYGMWFRTFFSVGPPDTNFETRGPLLAPALGSIAFGGIGFVLLVKYSRRIFRRYDTGVLTLLASSVLVYSAVLWLDNFRSYVQVGKPVAINGRYLLPILPPLLLMGALAAVEFCRRRGAWLKPAMAAAAVLCLLWGGGALTYILRSRDAWYWPDGGSVRNINHSVQRVLGPVTPGYLDKTEFMGRKGG